MTSDAQPFGWALRKNGTCLPDLEVDCGETVSPFRVCCPSGSSCPHALNVACCPSDSSCDAALEAKPACANSTWDLYINGGYFCCEQGTTAYAKEGGSDGCGIPGYKLKSDEHKLDIISSATVPTSTSTTTSTPTSTLTSTPTSTPSSQSTSHSSSTNTGAIAGGVVGGVAGAAIIAGLLWFLLRRSRRPKSQPHLQGLPYNTQYDGSTQPMSELESSQVGSQIAELETSGKSQPVFELPGNTR